MCHESGKLKQDAMLAHARFDNLVGKWRQSADAYRRHRIGGASTMDDCADELADALSEVYGETDQ